MNNLQPTANPSRGLTASDSLVRLLEGYDVQHVFGIPGVHTLELYRSLNQSTITHITPRHEQGAGFMADGYARVSGKPGVCFLISGPGMTNAITAMGQAWADSIPMLVISTVNSHGRMGSGSGWLHELPNQQVLVQGVCAFSHTVHLANELPEVLARAFALFDSARPRPVHIEIPINILSGTIKTDLFSSPPARLQRALGNPSLCQKAVELLQTASTPLILVGGGAQRAQKPIRLLAEKLDAPVVMTINGRGILPPSHPLAVGATASLAPVRQLIADSDIVLAIGTELGPTDYDFNEDGGFVINGKLIRIDIDPEQLMRGMPPTMAIVGDAEQTISHIESQLASRIQKHGQQDTVNTDQLSLTPGSERANFTLDAMHRAMTVREQRYLGLLNSIDSLLNSPIIVGDSTQIIYATNNAFNPRKVASYFNSATGFGTLGYALPAALGAAIAMPTEPVVAIIGDGGIQFSMGELCSAVDAKQPILLIVHENGGYQEIKRFMNQHAIEPLAVNVTVPDFIQIAKASYWQAHTIQSQDHLEEQLITFQQQPSPTLLLLKDSYFEEG